MIVMVANGIVMYAGLSRIGAELPNTYDAGNHGKSWAMRWRTSSSNAALLGKCRGV
jgi:hypothetical protein